MSEFSHSRPTVKDEALDVLRRFWGYSVFRPGQWEAMEAVLDGRDVLAVLPTGGGKSMLYQLPSVVNEGLTLVISPLVALIEDQVMSLQNRGISAGSITSSLTTREIDQSWTDAEFGKFSLLYITPERLQTDFFKARAQRLPVSLLAVDEAHCISEWGHDFRPAYRQIAEARQFLSYESGRLAPVLAVTATATPAVQRDIVNQLALKDPHVVVRGFDRPNITWSVLREENKRGKLIEIATALEGSGLVYAGTRRRAEYWAETLRGEGISAESYHAGLDSDVRSSVQQRWLDGTTRYIAATSAFGMGIDKPDVRVVVHLAVPPTLESYYQEAGRVGRDGGKAYAVLLVSNGDEDLPRAFTEEGHPSARTIQSVYDAVCSVAQVAIGSKPEDPVPIDVAVAAKVTNLTPMTVNASIERLSAQGVWQIVPQRPEHILVRANGGPDVLRTYAEEAIANKMELSEFVNSVRRFLASEAYSGWANVDIRYLAKRLNMTTKRTLDGLHFLADRGVLEILSANSGLQVLFSDARSEKVVLDVESLAQSRRRALRQLDDILQYIQSVTCRRQFLLAYFGERSAARCGNCDVCLGRHRPQVVTPADDSILRRILRHVEKGDGRDMWLDGEGISVHKRDGLGDWLINEGYLKITDPLTDSLALTPKGRRFAKTDT